MRSVMWVVATTLGFTLGGAALHSSGASAIGAILGAVVGAITGGLQNIWLGARNIRVIVAAVITVATAHALADGAPNAWGVPAVAAWALAWWLGWEIGVALAGALGLSFGSTPDIWAEEHNVIAGMLGIVFGAATSPAMRRILKTERALSSVG